MKKPIRRWCTVAESAEDIIWLHHASAHGESKVAYLRRMCEHYGGSLAGADVRLVELEIRVVPPKKRKGKGGRK